eukprot:TRINITY_DN16105_c0_g1_i1.p1 TRINITY_DN16105_c0_g1~~TRINITY_DN16105_c0_g1_i1.p1  ORF type:complete len:222 (+),score=99.49 TRINITY_DN16105_c0_g1_i1:9-674(+)
MKFFIPVLLLASVVLAFEDEDDYEAGFCLDHKTTGALCLAGSSLADKLPAAFQSCFPGMENMENRKGKRRGKGKKGKMGKRGKMGKMGKECPSFDDIMVWVEEEFSDDGCVLQQIGWMDADGNELKDAVMADLATLNPGVQAGLSEEAMAECAADMLADMEDKHGHCADSYSEEELVVLEEMGVRIAEYKCFMEMFQDACSDHIQMEYVEPLIQSLSAGAN